MIGFLAASTWWQYNQFQTNIKNLSFGVPSEIANSMPNANNQLSQIMGQIQNQAQQSSTTDTATTTNTKEYTAPDNSFKFSYPSDWQEVPNQTEISNVNGKILFSAYKTNNTLAINYLTVEESFSTSTDSIIEQYKKNAQSKSDTFKITESKIIKENQIIPLIEIKYNISDQNSETPMDITLKSAIVDKYVVTIILQNSGQAIYQETDKIFESISQTK